MCTCVCVCVRMCNVCCTLSASTDKVGRTSKRVRLKQCPFKSNSLQTPLNSKILLSVNRHIYVYQSDYRLHSQYIMLLFISRLCLFVHLVVCLFACLLACLLCASRPLSYIQKVILQGQNGHKSACFRFCYPKANKLSTCIFFQPHK